MTEETYDEKEVLVSETNGVYTIDIWVAELRERLLVWVIMVLLLWPVAMIAALLTLVYFGEAYVTITVPVFIFSVLLIIPLVFIVRKIAKMYQKELVYRNIVVPISVKENAVYMDGKKVKIKYDFGEDGFNIYTGIFKGFYVDGGVTESFRAFLENRKIPYR